MRDLILLIAVLVCPVVMGTMMLMMWRGMKARTAECATAKGASR